LSDYTIGLALGSVLIVLFDVYAYYRYRYSEDVLDNALRTRNRAEAAQRFETERAKRGDVAYAPQGVSSIEFQRGFGEASGLTQLETIPVSFDELKRASGGSSAEQEKEVLKLKDELALMNEQLATIKKQSRKKPEEEDEGLDADSPGGKTYKSEDYGPDNACEDYGVNQVSFAERSEQSERSEREEARAEERAASRAREREAFEADLNKRARASELESAANIGESEPTDAGLGESAFVGESVEHDETLETSELNEPSALTQDLSAEEEPEEEEFKSTQKLKGAAKAAKRKSAKTLKAKKGSKKQKTPARKKR
jgi:hypothetical protein